MPSCHTFLAYFQEHSRYAALYASNADFLTTEYNNKYWFLSAYVNNTLIIDKLAVVSSFFFKCLQWGGFPSGITSLKLDYFSVVGYGVFVYFSMGSGCHQYVMHTLNKPQCLSYSISSANSHRCSKSDRVDKIQKLSKTLFSITKFFLQSWT